MRMVLLLALCAMLALPGGAAASAGQLGAKDATLALVGKTLAELLEAKAPLPEVGQAMGELEDALRMEQHGADGALSSLLTSCDAQTRKYVSHINEAQESAARASARVSKAGDELKAAESLLKKRQAEQDAATDLVGEYVEELRRLHGVKLGDQQAAARVKARLAQAVAVVHQLRGLVLTREPLSLADYHAIAGNDTTTAALHAAREEHEAVAPRDAADGAETPVYQQFLHTQAAMEKLADVLQQLEAKQLAERHAATNGAQARDALAQTAARLRRLRVRLVDREKKLWRAVTAQQFRVTAARSAVDGAFQADNDAKLQLLRFERWLSLLTDDCEAQRQRYERRTRVRVRALHIISHIAELCRKGDNALLEKLSQELAEPKLCVYLTAAGDSMVSIADKFGLGPKALHERNPWMHAASPPAHSIIILPLAALPDWARELCTWRTWTELSPVLGEDPSGADAPPVEGVPDVAPVPSAALAGDGMSDELTPQAEQPQLAGPAAAATAAAALADESVRVAEQAAEQLQADLEGVIEDWVADEDEAVDVPPAQRAAQQAAQLDDVEGSLAAQAAADARASAEESNDIAAAAAQAEDSKQAAAEQAGEAHKQEVTAESETTGHVPSLAEQVAPAGATPSHPGELAEKLAEDEHVGFVGDGALPDDGDGDDEEDDGDDGDGDDGDDHGGHAIDDPAGEQLEAAAAAAAAAMKNAQARAEQAAASNATMLLETNIRIARTRAVEAEERLLAFSRRNAKPAMAAARKDISLWTAVGGMNSEALERLQRAQALASFRTAAAAMQAGGVAAAVATAGGDGGVDAMKDADAAAADAAEEAEIAHGLQRVAVAQAAIEAARIRVVMARLAAAAAQRAGDSKLAAAEAAKESKAAAVQKQERDVQLALPADRAALKAALHALDEARHEGDPVAVAMARAAVRERRYYVRARERQALALAAAEQVLMAGLLTGSHEHIAHGRANISAARLAAASPLVNPYALGLDAIADSQGFKSEGHTFIDWGHDLYAALAAHADDGLTVECWLRLPVVNLTAGGEQPLLSAWAQGAHHPLTGEVTPGEQPYRKGWQLGLRVAEAEGDSPPRATLTWLVVGSGGALRPAAVESATALHPGRWYHVLARYDAKLVGADGNATTELFIDGQLVAGASYAWGALRYAITGAGAHGRVAALAQVADGAAATAATPAVLDDVAFYSRPLPHAAMELLAKNRPYARKLHRMLANRTMTPDSPLLAAYPLHLMPAQTAGVIVRDLAAPIHNGIVLQVGEQQATEMQLAEGERLRQEHLASTLVELGKAREVEEKAPELAVAAAALEQRAEETLALESNVPKQDASPLATARQQAAEAEAAEAARDPCDDLHCGQHGRCVASGHGANATASCVCSPLFTGDACDVCIAGHTGERCEACLPLAEGWARLPSGDCQACTYGAVLQQQTRVTYEHTLAALVSDKHGKSSSFAQLWRAGSDATLTAVDLYLNSVDLWPQLVSAKLYRLTRPGAVAVEESLLAGKPVLLSGSASVSVAQEKWYTLKLDTPQRITAGQTFMLQLQACCDVSWHYDTQSSALPAGSGGAWVELGGKHWMQLFDRPRGRFRSEDFAFRLHGCEDKK